MPGIQNSKSTLDFLGALGVNRGDVIIEKSAEGLVKLAAFLIETASDNMDRKKNVASGDTISSMKIVNLDLSGSKMSLDVQILSTYKFLDKGVKGTEGGTGKYQFRTNKVSKKMATAILKWLRRRGKRGSGYPKQYRPYGTGLKTGGKGRIEQKDVKINKQVSNANNFKSLAYAVSTAIKKKGIRPTNFFTNAVKDTQKEAKKIIGEGFKLDIIQNLKLN